jgi:3-oxoacyl-(acyl-carrier-protein) synthase
LATNFGPAELIEAELSGGPYSGHGAYVLRDGLLGEDARRVASRLGVGGPVASLSLSCASGNAAVACALDLIRSGRAESALACGYDSIQRISWAGLSCLRVMALGSADGPPQVRPFDVDRAGTLFSEGAGCLLLESAESAARHGAELLAEVAGAGVNNNAYHLTHADNGGRGMADVLRMALDDAGIDCDQIDHINAHGTGTKLNDAIEAAAFHNVFGDRAGSIPVVSNKGGLGHGMGAASSFEAIASVMSLRSGKVPPTVNLGDLDPQCRLDVVRGVVRQMPIATVLNNSAGIGGANAALILRRVAGDAPAPPGGES